jgi:Ca2+-binding RTX toxin-like protein
MVGDAMATSPGATADGGEDDLFFGDKGNDHIVGDSYAKKGIALGAGDDNGTGGQGDDTIAGDSSAGIKAIGFHGRDVFIGNKQDDLLIGDNEPLRKNTVISGGGDDFLRGGQGGDHFKAGPGRDHCQAGGQHDDRDLSSPPCEERGNFPKVPDLLRTIGSRG